MATWRAIAVPSWTSSSKQANVAGADPGPGTRAELAAEQAGVLQVGYLLHFRVADSQTKISAVFTQEGVEVHIGAVARPCEITERRLGIQWSPLFGLHVIE